MGSGVLQFKGFQIGDSIDRSGQEARTDIKEEIAIFAPFFLASQVTDNPSFTSDIPANLKERVISAYDKQAIQMEMIKHHTDKK